MPSQKAKELVDNLIDACFYTVQDLQTAWTKDEQALLEYIEMLELIADAVVNYKEIE